MKKLVILSIFVAFLWGKPVCAQVFEYQNPISNGIDPNGLRDCQVLRDGDWWYLTGTSFPHWPRQETDGNLNKGVVLYKSKDLLNWQFVNYVVKRPEIDRWYYRRFWAPEIQKIGGKYYALFNCRNDSLGFVGQFTGYAVAEKIEGPYKVITEEKPLCDGNDLTFFEDTDGKVWAFWNRGPEFGIGFAQIDLQTATFLTQPQTAIQPAKVDYEYNDKGELVKVPGYDGRPIPKVAKYYDWDAIGIEGAYVIKNDETYYLFYSSWTRGYEIGYATAPKITGPWTKYPGNPFYGAMNKETCKKNGFDWCGDENNPFTQVGHNEIFTGPDGRFWLSCHGIREDGIPMLVIDPIWFDSDGNIKSDGPTYTKQTVKLAEKTDSVWLFASFKDPGDAGIWFALSNDGKKWEPVNNDLPLLVPDIEKGKMRDPYIFRDENNRYHLLWTSGIGRIGHSVSIDLMNWEEHQFIPIWPGDKRVLNTWAPEAIFDNSQKKWIIFWSATVKGDFPQTEGQVENEKNHRIYFMTTTDWNTFSKPALFFDPGYPVIDATIFADGQQFLMVFKDERRWPLQKQLRTAISSSLYGPWKEISEPITRPWTEGPSLVKNNQKYLLYYDSYKDSIGMEVMETKDFRIWKILEKGVKFPDKYKHGSFIKISREEADIISSPLQQR